MKRAGHAPKRKSKTKKLKPKVKNHSFLIVLFIFVVFIFIALSVGISNYTAEIEKTKAEQLVKLEKANTLRKKADIDREEKKKAEECAKAEEKLTNTEKAFNIFKNAEKENQHKSAEELAKEEKVNKLLSDAKKEYKAGNFQAAKEKLAEALKLSPARKDIAELYMILKTIGGILPSGNVKTRESELIRKAIDYYMDGDAQSALDIFNYVLYLQPENDKLRKFYRDLERPKDDNEYYDGPYKDNGIHIVKEKLLRTLGLFYEGKFTEVIENCKQILRLDPKNITALERMGSAYYKLGKKQEAKAVWEKAYKLNPDNKTLKKFIDKIEKETTSEILDDTFDFKNKTPLEFLEFLKQIAKNNRDKAGSYTVGQHGGWIKEEHIPKLIEILDSTEPCANVCSYLSSYLEMKSSTIGHEAAFLIKGFRKGTYPPELNSLRNRSPGVTEKEKAEIKQWWAEYKKKK
ncbi:MAG: hypothetical protein A2231_10450 [Candidatus Firestonebacteria bacterium RIFOXYA2_FULL_40_8]|nr:MAG: hypothetical protein A2231_10450 [Candidatus Firestonebacteria bacterium RIFOXYA2_FULL_40_8]